MRGLRVNSFHAPGDWGSGGGAMMVKVGGKECYGRLCGGG